MSGSTISRPRHSLFVDVPPSPFPLSRYSSLSRKENAPLTIASHLYRKRKLSDPEGASIGSTKKQKLAPVTPLQTSSSVPLDSAPNASADFPNGYIYCHQCSKKRDISASIHCTAKQNIASKGKSIKEQRCNVKFCRACLKNRYNEDLDTIKSQKSTGKNKEHIETEDYIFKCPKCRCICNCARCRKLQGLEPTGNLRLASVARKVGAAGSAAQPFARGPNPMAEKSEQQSKPKVVAAPIKHSAPSAKSSPHKSRQKMAPLLNWIQIPVSLDLKEAEARFGIREFMMRFACIMEPNVPKVHLKELEDISGKRPEDGDEMTGWVSEACVRAIILGVLGLLSKHDDAKVVATAIKDIRATGTNLNKIWAILSTLRRAVNQDSDHEIHFSIPDPLPPPTSTVMRNTRNMRSNRDPKGDSLIYIVQSAQMIPVVEALIETAIHTDTVRDELEGGVKIAKDWTKTVKDFCKSENDKREVERKAFRASLKDKGKAADQHQMNIKWETQQRHLRQVENALKLVLPGFAPRFTPLGIDDEGRVFWALSPGIAERNAALDFITAVTSGSDQTEREDKRSRVARRRTTGGEERDAMNQWSWFLAIWGKKPIPAKTSPRKLKRDTGNSEDDEDVEKWWAVCEPEEIRKVAEWVAIESGGNQKEPSVDEDCSSLVKGLKEHAALLEWRLLEDRFDADNIGGRASN